jgi:hypothetical protein
VPLLADDTVAAHARVFAAPGAPTPEPGRSHAQSEPATGDALVRLTDAFRHHWLEQSRQATLGSR